jgi:nucleoside-triphosphatase
LEKRVFILTGSPGIGKTTVLAKTVSALKEHNVLIGGMFSREVREGRERVGFEIIDISSLKHDWLAHINLQDGPQVGKYHVNLDNLDSIGALSVNVAVENCDVIAIDEIGPMELFSTKFKEATQKALDGKKLVIAVVHWKAQDKLVLDAKNRADAETFSVTSENRETLHEVLVEKAIAFLKQA